MGKRQVLEGIKVADFSWWGVAPQACRELAEHGATVVRIESHRHPDGLRTMVPYKDDIPGVDRSAFGAAYNTNKYSISLDFARPKGLEIAKKLVQWADIFAESNAPGVMAKLGLDYESCKKIKPDIIYFSTCAQGQYGPHHELALSGAHSMYVAGFGEVTGWPDRGAVWTNTSYTDYISPWYVVTAVIGALLYRRKTGKGMYLDQSQLEAGITFLGPAMLDYAVNNRVATRMGNRIPYAAPHGAYRCKGDERWCVIAVFTDEEWRSFCQAIGNPDWAQNEKFATLLGRKENEDELDRLIEEWTQNHAPEEVMHIMQAAGVPAAVVQNAEDIFEDPQVKHREHFRFLEHKVIGRHAYNAPAYKLSKTPANIWKAGQVLGEDNEYVYKEILGLSDEDIADLVVEGVITTEADLPEIRGLY